MIERLGNVNSWSSLDAPEQRNEGNGDRNGHTRINFIVSFVEISPAGMIPRLTTDKPLKMEKLVGFYRTY